MVAIQQAQQDKGLPGWHMGQSGPTPVLASSAATRRICIFVAPYACEVGQVSIMNSNSAITGANTNTVHLNLINGGPEGAGTTQIAARDLVLNTDLDIGKTLLYDSLTSPTQLDEGDMLELEFEEVGTGLGVAIDELLLGILYRGDPAGQ